MLSHKDFYDVIKQTPLTSVDIYFLYKNELLLGLRNNEPAKNYWFTPGCKGYKNETQYNLIERVSKTECGLSINPEKCKLINVYDHLYDNNFKDNKFGTHYLNIAYIYEVNAKERLTLNCNQDNQHSRYVWTDINDAYNHDMVHNNVKKTIKDIVK
jgi:colanic acid biosynthesis protein WcaH